MVADTFSPDALPTEAELARAAELKVFDEDGKEHTFGSLIGEGRTIVVFIRHFHCCVCQDYVSQLSAVRSEALANASARLLIIGCGEYTPIKVYKADTAFPYPIYANPPKDLYVTLGMTRRTLAATPAGEEKKSYLKHGYLGYVLGGMWNGPIRHPQHAFSAGDIAQLGGEFIFEPGPKVAFVARMKHTADHVEVKDLMEKAGVEFP